MKKTWHDEILIWHNEKEKVYSSEDCGFDNHCFPWLNVPITEVNIEFFACPRTLPAARDFSPINCDVSSNAPFNFLPVPVSSNTLYTKHLFIKIERKKTKLTEQHVILHQLHWFVLLADAYNIYMYTYMYK